MPQSPNGLLFVNQSAGTVLSSDYVLLPAGVDTVALTVTPGGTAPSGTVTVLTSADPNVGYTQAADPTAVQTLTAPIANVLVGGLLPFVRVQLVASAGMWMVEVVPSLVHKVVQSSASQVTTAQIGQVVTVGQSVLLFGKGYPVAGPQLTASFNTGDIAVGPYRELAIDCDATVVGGTSPTLTFDLARKDAIGLYRVVWTSTPLTTTGTVSTSVGAGCTVPAAFGDTVRVDVTIGGSYGSGEGWGPIHISLKGK